MSALDLPLSEPIRLNQIGAGLERTLTPDGATRGRIARALDLRSLDAFEARMSVAPHGAGWRLSGRVRAEAVQTCGLTLEPLPVSVDAPFSIDLIEAPANEEAVEEVEISLDDDSPDLIEDGRIDLGLYAVEQLSLNLDPFPRKPDAVFEQPPEPVEISPFAVLKRLKESGEDKGD